MRRSARPLGFTLVEVLVSIAIALLLILGVNTVFEATSQTVGGGIAILTLNRDARTVMRTFTTDMQTLDPVNINGYSRTADDGPCFIIRSQHVYAFRDATDLQGATTASTPQTDTLLYPLNNPLTGFSLFPNNTAPVPYIGTRSHRVDQLGFFAARGLFNRQTSSNTYNYVDTTTTATEAWVVYGHAAQPNNAYIINAQQPATAAANPSWTLGPGDPSTPGGATNDNNYVTSDWMLARMALLLNPNPPPTITTYIADTSVASAPTSPGLSPLVGSTSGTGQPLSQANVAGPIPYTLSTCRYDLARSSIEAYNASGRPNGIKSFGFNGANFGSDWWDSLINYRLHVSPYIVPTPNQPTSGTNAKITPFGAAAASPDLMRGCSQFIIEFAGNFYTKDVNGNKLAAVPSGPFNKTPYQGGGFPAGYSAQNVPVPDQTGQLDFYVTTDANGLVTRHTRWYGFPRSVNPDLTSAAGPTLNPLNGDVLPLRDIEASLDSTNWVGGKFADAERIQPAYSLPYTTIPYISSGNYWTGLQSASDAPGASANGRYTYTAAWGPDVQYMPMPRMLRITIGLDDREGRLSKPQMYEYVLTLPN